MSSGALAMVSQIASSYRIWLVLCAGMHLYNQSAKCLFIQPMADLSITTVNDIIILSDEMSR